MNAVRNVYLVHDDGTAELLCGDKTILLDAADVDTTSKYQWVVGLHGYATHGAGKKQILMHRLLTGCSNNDTVDHINRNRLDNRRSNLRVCTRTENAMNKPRLSKGQNPYKGICLCPDGMWQAQITLDGKAIYLGRSRDPVTAAKAYDTAARVIYGEFAYLNFPDSEDSVLLPTKQVTRLKRDDVNSIRILYQRGMSIKQIAQIYDHSYSSISRIVRNRSFKVEVGSCNP